MKKYTYAQRKAIVMIQAKRITITSEALYRAEDTFRKTVSQITVNDWKKICEDLGWCEDCADDTSGFKC